MHPLLLRLWLFIRAKWLGKENDALQLNLARPFYRRLHVTLHNIPVKVLARECHPFTTLGRFPPVYYHVQVLQSGTLIPRFGERQILVPSFQRLVREGDIYRVPYLDLTIQR